MTVYYCSPSGSDTAAGTQTAPVKTIAKALTKCSPGDIVELAPGSYSTFSPKAGAAGAPISVRGQNDPRQGAPTAKIVGDLDLDQPYFVLSRLERTGGQWAHDITADYVEIWDCWIHHVATGGSSGSDGGSAIEVYKDDYTALMKGVKIVGNVIHDIGNGVGANELVQGIYLSNRCQGGVVANNVVTRVTDFGIHGYRETADWLICHNTIDNCGRGLLAAKACRIHNNVVGNTGTNFDVRTTPLSCSGNKAWGNGGGSGSGIARIADPGFVTAGADWHLKAGSVLIDAGDSAWSQPIDIYGTPRPQGAGVDAGAFEFATSTPPPDPGPDPDPQPTTCEQRVAQLEGALGQIGAITDGQTADPLPAIDAIVRAALPPGVPPAPVLGAPSGLTGSVDSARKLTLTWTLGAEAATTEVHEFNVDPSATLKATLPAPTATRVSGALAVRGEPGLRYAVRSVGADGSKSAWSNAVKVIVTATGGTVTAADPIDSGGSSGAGTPPPGPVYAYPADLFGPGWKLTVPVDADGSGAADEIKQPALAGYSSQFCQLSPAKDSVIFRCWHGGATTSGSSNPRSELREMIPGAGTGSAGNAAWSTSSGRHQMRVQSRVNRLTVVRPHVVLAQIHDASDDVAMWRLEADKLWLTDGDTAHGFLVASGVQLGQWLDMAYDVQNGLIKFLYGGQQVWSKPVATSGCYFKAGAYLQSNPSTAPGESTSEYVEVETRLITVTHT